jgi:hypothetical protein
MRNWMTFPVPASPYVDNVFNADNRPEIELGQASDTRPHSPGLPIGEDSLDWKDAFEERAAICEFDGLYPRPVAEVLAFGDIVNQWHFQNAVVEPGQCAGCGHHAECDVIRLADCADVHLGCVRAYGLKWRRAASDALAAMGLTIPEGWSI